MRISAAYTRKPRAIAMLVTVLMVIAAATIAAAITRQSLDATTAADRNTGVGYAESLTAETLAAFEAEISNSPDVFLSRVLPGEASRTCTVGPNAGTVFPAGSNWPASCGVDWIYAATPSNWTGARLEIHPPSTESPHLTAVARARTDIGIESTETNAYIRAGVNTFTVALANDDDPVTFDFSQSPYPSSNVTVVGSLYSRSVDNSVVHGGITPPATVAAEQLTSNVATAGIVNLFAAEGADLENVRQLTAAPITEASAAQSAAVIRRIACATEHSNVTYTHSEGLCLRPGVELATVDGETVTVPGTTESFAVIPHDGHLQIYTSPDLINLSATSPLLCGSTGSLRSCAASLTNSNFPAHEDFWTLTAEVLQPASGTMFTEGQLMIGMCGAFIPNSPCDAHTPDGNPGSTFTHPISVAADQILLGAPINSDVPVALAATSDITIPYWARPHGTPFNVDAHLYAGSTTLSQGIRAFPDDLTFSGPGDQDWTDTATFTGSITATNHNGKLGIEGFENIIYQPAAANAAYPLWVTSGDLSWARHAAATGHLTAEGFDWRRLGVEYHLFDTANQTSIAGSALEDSGGDFHGLPVSLSGTTGTFTFDDNNRGIPSVGLTGSIATADTEDLFDTATIAAHLTISDCVTPGPFTGFTDGLTFGCDADGHLTATLGTTTVTHSDDWTYGLNTLATFDGTHLSLYVNGLHVDTQPAAAGDTEEMFLGGLSDITVSELAFIARNVTDIEAVTATNYLQRKWGTTGDDGTLSVKILEITYDDLIFDGTGNTYSPTVLNGSGAYSFSYVGSLPPQINFDSSTGVFTGPTNWNETVIELDSYWDHTCVITSSHRMYCWGQSGHRQIDHDSGGVRNTPDVPAGLGGTNITTLGVGQKATCVAINSGNRLVCMGELDHADSSSWRHQVANISGIVDISMGTSQGCFMRSNGWVYCGGQRGLGQVVDGGAPWLSIRMVEPLRATSLGQWTVAELSAGAKHYCARMTNGTAKCWGQANTSYSGQLGRGSGGGTAGVPVTVVRQNGTALTNVDEMDGGGEGHCAITDGRKKIHCWGFGRNYASDIGLFGSADDYLTSLSVSHASTVCVLNNGVPHCWGTASTDGATGVLGDGTSNSTGYYNLSAGDAVIPTGTEIGGFTSVQVGVVGCAIDQGGGVTCWGNDFGTGNGNSLGTGGTRVLVPLERYTIGGNPGFPADLTVTVSDLNISAVPGSTDERITAVNLPS